MIPAIPGLLTVTFSNSVNGEYLNNSKHLGQEKFCANGNDFFQQAQDIAFPNILELCSISALVKSKEWV